MEVKGFNENRLPAQSKETLQSDTWKAVRTAMKTEVIHFTAERTVDYAYGWTWAQVVNEYLRTSYKAESSNSEVVVLGVTYKTLKRPGMTVFYDAGGNTLFDVTHERLDKEYERLMGSGVRDVVQNMDAEWKENADGKDNSIIERAEVEEEDITNNWADDDVIPMGTASLKEIVTGVPVPTAEEIRAAEEENAKSVRQRAKEKLEKERKSAKHSTFADPIIEYLLKRCSEDEGMAADVVQEHKTWERCFDHIYAKARKQATGSCAVVRDDVVYEWAEDYYHLDDKAEAEKKAKEDAERKKRQAETAKRTPKAKAKKKVSTSATPKAKAAEEEPKQELKPEKPKRNNRDMEGQMDIFSLMDV